MMVIWDGLAVHLIVLATTSCNCINIRMYDRQLTWNLTLKMN